jgi:hypothetical protein
MGREKLLALSIRWFDYHLKGINNETAREPAVNISSWAKIAGANPRMDTS